MSDADVEIYRRHTGREEPPAVPVSELALAIGRRGGKSVNDAAIAVYLAVRFDSATLASGETAVVQVLAADRDQARVVFNYAKAIFELPAFRPWLARDPLKDRIELGNGVAIEVRTASFKTVRGYTVIGAIGDEIAFWSTDETGANPDTQIIGAIRPAMATVPSALLIMASSPYSARGELYTTHDRYYGVDDPHTLAWNASTEAMNPTVPKHVIERAFETDPASAIAEYGADGKVQFRHDVSAFLSPDAIKAVTVEGRLELPPRREMKYVAFTDPSGGSRDSFTLAIAHGEDGKAVLDCVRERKPPFSPDDVVAEFAKTLRSYGLSTVRGDRYAGAWTVERFQRHGITLEHSEDSKSEVYMEALPLINGATVELLDIPALFRQFVGLERRTARGGKDSIDHARGAHDDIANSVAGALVMAAPQADTGKRFHFSVGSAPPKGQGLGTGLLQIAGKLRW
jgi:hypothetical protein